MDSDSFLAQQQSLAGQLLKKLGRYLRDNFFFQAQYTNRKLTYLPLVGGDKRATDFRISAK